MGVSKLIYGTAGWSYNDWLGHFYPRGTAPADYLARYARVFTGVEVDSTYYGIPSPHTVAGWAAATAETFRFFPKMVDQVTHERFLVDCGDLLHQFLDAMQPLGPRLGAIVLQFPYYRRDSGVTLKTFLARLLPFLDLLPGTIRFAVEVRNKTFLKPALLEELRRRRIALVLIDHVWMPSPADYLDRLRDLLTADFLPIRLLGDRYAIERTTTIWNRTVVDREPQLTDWARLIRRAMEEMLFVSAFANNHYAGYAPATARRLAELILGTAPALPATPSPSAAAAPTLFDEPLS
jgi:uncharacterized protein YecE (DUF72 family)